jgi:hypothetical protein
MNIQRTLKKYNLFIGQKGAFSEKIKGLSRAEANNKVQSIDNNMHFLIFDTDRDLDDKGIAGAGKKENGIIKWLF